MAELPSGTVTFLFSDVEGSTRLLTRLRGRYAEVLGEHQRLLRAAFVEHGGREVHTEGDGFFVAFARASDAIAAAVSAQRALASQRWPDGVQVRVRMGVHTGEAEIRDDDYVGLDVHRAARICAVGRGGQVLISSATRELVADELPGDVALRDLGEHRLKDLARPERLFQLVIGGLRVVFPPLASLSPGSDAAYGLPPSPNRTIGRAEDVHAITDRLPVDGVRLLTLTGPGGVGKTRLALESARAAGPLFRDGAAWVELAAVGRAEHVAGTIARALAVTPLAGETPEQALLRQLENKDLLVVLDNFEHVLEAAPLVARLLADCARLTVLATSREALDLACEHVYPVAPLALPAGGAPLTPAGVDASPAGELFLAAAERHDPSFRVGDTTALAIAEICTRLDGLPLAIELAAARTGLLTVPELAARLREGVDALGTGPRDAPARQRTLTATLEWSYALLVADERAALAGLSVFAGGCTVEAAQAVTGASLDVLEALVAKNLVRRRAVPGARVRLTLLETVADFARGRLAERGGGADLFERHLDYYVALAEPVAPELERSDALALMAELDQEVDNLRAALAWAIDQRAALRALRLTTAVSRYWDLRDPREGAAWLGEALTLSSEDTPPALQAAALAAYARCLSEPRTVDQAAAAARESLEIARSSGDTVRRADSALTLAGCLLVAGRFEDGYRHASEAERLAHQAGDDPMRAGALEVKALAAPSFVEALTLGEQAAVIYRRAGAYRRLAMLQSSLTYNALFHGDVEAARRLTPEAMRSAENIGDTFVIGFIHGNLGLVMLFTDDTTGAATAFARELHLAVQYRYHPQRYEAINGLAGVAAALGQDELAACLLAAAEAGGPERHPAELAQRLEERFFGPARARLGESAWRAASADGAALTPNEAIDVALRVQRIASPAAV
jgi:predicted ATPase/class 3 adenylate cyclase